MNSLRNRAKEVFPAVSLTLLSIVQAIALELLWAYISESDFLFELTLVAIIAWAKIAATVLGNVLIWTVYASNVMRFRWVPTMSDSVYPFVIGLLEFMTIEFLHPDYTGEWLLLMGVVFALMVFVSHATLKSARADKDNAAFFAQSNPAALKDFYPHIAAISFLLISGVVLLLTKPAGPLALILIVLTNITLLWQFWLNKLFWDQSMAEEAS